MISIPSEDVGKTLHHLIMYHILKSGLTRHICFQMIFIQRNLLKSTWFFRRHGRDTLNIIYGQHRVQSDLIDWCIKHTSVSNVSLLHNVDVHIKRLFGDYWIVYVWYPWFDINVQCGTYISDDLSCTPDVTRSNVQYLLWIVLKAHLLCCLMYSAWNVSLSVSSSWLAVISTPVLKYTKFKNKFVRITSYRKPC